MNKENKLILEFTEFNLQRMNSDSVQPAMHVDDPQLSTNAFDKHQDAIRVALSKVNDILRTLKSNTVYSDLRSQLSLENQDVKSLKIQRIYKSSGVRYDVYLTIVIRDKEYWGRIKDITGVNTTFDSELFMDDDLYKPNEWVIKTKGIVIQTIKKWLTIKKGEYELIADKIYTTSSITGNRMSIVKGEKIKVINTHKNSILIEYNDDRMELINDNFIFFNWWFKPSDL